MKKHVELLAILHITLGSLALVIGVVIAAILMGTGVIASLTTSGADQKSVMFILSIVAVGIALFGILVGGPLLIAGLGLMHYKSWARSLALIFAFIDVINIPFGTIVSVYTFWVLLKDETISLFCKPIKGIDIRD